MSFMHDIVKSQRGSETEIRYVLQSDGRTAIVERTWFMDRQGDYDVISEVVGYVED